MHRRTAVLAVGGHESAGGDALHSLFGSPVRPVPVGRELIRRARACAARGEPVCVVPLTLGRDPELVADTVRALRALTAEERADLVLARPFGTVEHLVGWLRAAAGRAPVEAALLVTAPAGEPADDAELFRIARLVRQHGRHRLVEVALSGGDPDPAEGVRRCRALGAEQVFLVSAAFTAPPLEEAAAAAPVAGAALLSPSSAAEVLHARVSEAWEHRHRTGEDGLRTAALTYGEHGHGHGHGHAHGHDELTPVPDIDRSAS